jgi:tetratricopeptide (TPR) repeat protein
MTPARVLSVALFAAVVLGPLVAQAQATDAQKKEARELNEKATRLYEVGRYGEAIEEYQKVYLLVEDPVLLYNIAQSYRLWGKPEDSVRFYRNYLRRSPNAPNRADVEKKIAELDRTIEERKRAPVTPTAPPVTAPTEATAPPPPPITQPSVTPPPATVTVEPPATTVVEPMGPPPDAHRGRRIAGIGFLIGGGVLIAGSVATGLVAAQKAKDLERMSKDPLHPVFDPGIQKSGQNANKAAIVTGVLGAIAGVTGGVLLLTSGSSSSKVAIYPLVGPTLAGGGAHVSF